MHSKLLRQATSWSQNQSSRWTWRTERGIKNSRVTAKEKGWKTVQPPKSVTTWMTDHHYFLCLVPSSLLQSSWSLESALNITAGPLRSALLSSSCAKMGDRNAKVLPEPERKIDSPCISKISLLVWVLLRLSALSASRHRTISGQLGGCKLEVNGGSSLMKS